MTESRFRFVVNPDLDSLANRMVLIRERGRVDFIVVYIGDHAVTSFYCYALPVTSGFTSEYASKLDSLHSRIQIRALNGRFH